MKSMAQQQREKAEEERIKRRYPKPAPPVRDPEEWTRKPFAKIPKRSTK
jgi:hypothetical protein